MSTSSPEHNDDKKISVDQFHKEADRLLGALAEAGEKFNSDDVQQAQEVVRAALFTQVEGVEEFSVDDVIDMTYKAGQAVRKVLDVNKRRSPFTELAEKLISSFYANVQRVMKTNLEAIDKSEPKPLKDDKVESNAPFISRDSFEKSYADFKKYFKAFMTYWSSEDIKISRSSPEIAALSKQFDALMAFENNQTPKQFQSNINTLMERFEAFLDTIYEEGWRDLTSGPLYDKVQKIRSALQKFQLKIFTEEQTAPPDLAYLLEQPLQSLPVLDGNENVRERVLNIFAYHKYFYLQNIVSYDKRTRAPQITRRIINLLAQDEIVYLRKAFTQMGINFDRPLKEIPPQFLPANKKTPPFQESAHV